MKVSAAAAEMVKPKNPETSYGHISSEAYV